MKETQELIFNTSAPSSVIVATAADDSQKLAPQKTEERPASPSKEKRHRKWTIFSRRGAKVSAGDRPSEDNSKSRKVSSSKNGAAATLSPEHKKSTGKKEKAKPSQDNPSIAKQTGAEVTRYGKVQYRLSHALVSVLFPYN